MDHRTSGIRKSTLAKALKAQFAERGVDVAVLESDELRQVFTPDARYDEKESDVFYRQMTYIGALLVGHGVSVIFDPTANRRVWREDARRAIPRFVEVHVDSALDVCMTRDPKGICRRARMDEVSSVPGFTAPYEAPEKPDVVVHGDSEAPDSAARRVVAELIQKGYIQSTGLC